MTTTLQAREVVELGLKVIGLEKIGFHAAPANAELAYQSMSQMRKPDGSLMFPLATARLKEIQGRMSPSYDRCKEACDEISPVYRQLKQEEREQARQQMRGDAPRG